MKIALLVMTDGRRQYIHDTIASASLMLKGPITEKWMHDDSGDEENRQWLHEQFPSFIQIGDGPRKGFGGAYSFAWKTLASKSESDFVFNLEDDFTFNREVPLEDLAYVLGTNSHIFQMALRRQAWNSEERTAGGIIERWPDDFQEKKSGELTWLEHRRWFTTNPSLLSRSLLTKDWPVGKDAEGHFSISLFQEDPENRSGYWGDKLDSPWVEHTGIKRQPGGTY